MGESPPPPGSLRDAPLRDRLLAVVRERGYTRRDEPFLLSSGASSRDYVDLRRALARGEDLALAARAVLAHLAEKGVALDAIGGMTMGADPVAHAVAVLAGAEWFSVRKEPKGHGRGRRVEGADLGPGREAVVFEDTVTTGGSLAQAVEAVRETGAAVLLACTLLDRGDGAAPRLASLGVPYTALLDFHDLGIEPVGPYPVGPGPAGI
jgi:orotate phosphoribosyltransferase